MKPLTPKPLELDVAFVVGIPYRDSTHAGVIEELEHVANGSTDAWLNVDGVKTIGRPDEGLGNLSHLLTLGGLAITMGYSRDRGVDEVKMTLKGCGNRVAHRPDSLLTCLRMGVDSEVGVEHLVRLANRHRDGEPVSRGGAGRRVQSRLLQPCVHSFGALRARSNELLNLRRHSERKVLYKLFVYGIHVPPPC
jgi:hypothetical protein